MEGILLLLQATVLLPAETDPKPYNHIWLFSMPGHSAPAPPDAAQGKKPSGGLRRTGGRIPSTPPEKAGYFDRITCPFLLPENVLTTSKSSYFRAFIQLITKATPPRSFFRIGVILLCKLSLLPLPDNSFSKRGIVQFDFFWRQTFDSRYVSPKQRYAFLCGQSLQLSYRSLSHSSTGNYLLGPSSRLPS